jgi:hypothetical protein
MENYMKLWILCATRKAYLCFVFIHGLTGIIIIINIIIIIIIIIIIEDRDSVVGVATVRAGRSGVRTLVGARFSALVPTGPGAHLPPVQWVPAGLWR